VKQSFFPAKILFRNNSHFLQAASPSVFSGTYAALRIIFIAQMKNIDNWHDSCLQVFVNLLFFGRRLSEGRKHPQPHSCRRESHGLSAQVIQAHRRRAANLKAINPALNLGNDLTLAGKYGKDSSEYEMAGGTCASEINYHPSTPPEE
jgi:hypothetical protein